jgi:hypothetical protein
VILTVADTGVCDHCGGEFLRSTGRGRPRRFCCNDCTYAHHKELSEQRRQARLEASRQPCEVCMQVARWQREKARANGTKAA